MKIYVGNLSFDATEEDLREAFENSGQVESVTIATYRDSGRSRGFGFVEMPVQGEAEAAIADLNGTELKGRALRVEEARPRTEGRRDGGRGGERRGDRSW